MVIIVSEQKIKHSCNLIQKYNNESVCMNAGMNGYVPKPINPEQFVKSVWEQSKKDWIKRAYRPENNRTKNIYQV